MVSFGNGSLSRNLTGLYHLFFSQQLLTPPSSDPSYSPDQNGKGHGKGVIERTGFGREMEMEREGGEEKIGVEVIELERVRGVILR